MGDWQREIDEFPDYKTDNYADIPRSWYPSPDTINAIKGRFDGAKEHEFVDLGIQDVPVNQINLSDSTVHSADDYKKVTRADMVDGFTKFEKTVRPAVEKGAEGDYFSDLDKTQGLDYEKGYQRVYDAFYGNEAVRLDKVGDTYTVVNGYHRLAIAKEIGLSTVPAWVIEQRDGKRL